MWLLRTADQELEDFADQDVPPYAILSHRWSSQEVNFQDYRKKRNRHFAGYDKIRSACMFAQLRGHSYLWVDTCCIDKRSSAELSEAINSMCLWYAEAEECFAYLADVNDSLALTTHSAYEALSQDIFDEIVQSVRNSEWFTRGWTLQELIAPRYVIFCTKRWNIIGFKAASASADDRQVAQSLSGLDSPTPSHAAVYERDLSRMIHEITGIPEVVLCNPERIKGYSAAQIFSWASERETARVEDAAYCLLGLFGVNMPLLYGERHRAFRRLQQQIMESSTDESFLAWRTETMRTYINSETMHGYQIRNYDLLATSPGAFDRSSLVRRSNIRGVPRFSIQSGLLRLHVEHGSGVWQLDDRIFMVQLHCGESGGAHGIRSIEPCYILLSLQSCGHFQRIEFDPPIPGGVRALFRPSTWNDFDSGDLYMHASGEC